MMAGKKLIHIARPDTMFYFSKENNEACVGKILLGMEDMAPFAKSGEIGPRLEIFRDRLEREKKTFEALAQESQNP
jgi:hypothetical protein